MKADKHFLREEFFKKYGDRATNPVLFYSPGRVNLIGEHTDYNGGYVFPCALDFGTSLVVRKTTSPGIELCSLNFPGEETVPVSPSYKPIAGSWTNYPIGVINEFALKGIRVPGGLELFFYGNITNGAGLYYSAS